MDWLKIDRNSWIILYKLLGDALFLLLLFFALALVADGLIPGIVSDHISFLRLIFLVSLDLAALYVTGSLAKIDLKDRKGDKKTAIFLTILASLAVLNSLLKINFYLALFISFLAIISGFLTFKTFFAKK